jgi:hypothetical protein
MHFYSLQENIYADVASGRYLPASPVARPAGAANKNAGRLVLSSGIF